MELDAFDDITPRALAWRPDGGVEITFSDGHRGVFERPFLRAMCPCASCAGTHGPPTTLVDARAPLASAAPTPAEAAGAEGKRKASFAISAGPRPVPRQEALRLLGAEPVGAYGMKLRWGDGHATGIYTWRYLRAVSPGDGTAAHPPAPGALAARRPAAQQALRTGADPR
jgi:DUF971 family protein